MLSGWPLCRTELLPSGSERNPPLPKAETLRQAAGSLWKHHLRKGKKCWAAAVRKDWKNVGDNLQTPMSEKKCEEALHEPDWAFPATCGGTCWRKQHPSMDSPHPEQGPCLGGAAATRSPWMRNCSGRSCGQWGTRSGAACSTGCGRKAQQQALKDSTVLYPGRAHGGARQRRRGKEQHKRMDVEWPWPPFLCTAWGQGEEVGELGMKEWSSALEQSRVWRRCFCFVFVSHHLTLFFSEIKLIFPEFCFANVSNWWVVPLSLSWPTDYLILFSPHVCYGDEVRDQLVVFWQTAEFNIPQFKWNLTYHKHKTLEVTISKNPKVLCWWWPVKLETNLLEWFLNGFSQQCLEE